MQKELYMRIYDNCQRLMYYTSTEASIGSLRNESSFNQNM